jgi:hypothetical protein
VNAALLVVVLAAVALAVAVPVWLVARRRTATRPPNDDRGDDIVRGLTEEVRKWRAEAAYWRSTAERLQRELDGRGQ